MGAVERTTWTPVVGLADEMSERGRLCGIPLVRSSRRQPSTTGCPGGDALPQGGVVDLDPLSWQGKRKREPWSLSPLERKSGGGQNYSGANLRLIQLFGEANVIVF